MFSRGAVIGKFYPPHLGHRHLIDAAAAQSTEVAIIVCWRPGESPDGPTRAAWLQEMYPAAAVLLVEDRYDPDDSNLWARLAVEWLGYAPDVVFTSEAYGPSWAEAIGCAHVAVDPGRQVYPCSGRLVRADPLGNWQYLTAPARAFYAARICVVGAESTGTTTLASSLAEHYDTTWVPEYGRELTEWKYSSGNLQWTANEFLHVAQEQQRREDLAARDANRLLFCDTDALATAIWHERYMGTSSAAVGALVDPRRYVLYLLTDVDTPFVQDGVRDGEHLRAWMHNRFLAALDAATTPYFVMQGSPEQRLELSTEIIDSRVLGLPPAVGAGLTPT